MQEVGPEKFTPDEIMEGHQPATPEDAAEKAGEGDEWTQSGKPPEETPAE